MQINLNVTDERVTVVERPDIIPSGNIEYIQCEFELADCFDGLTVRASFNGVFRTLEDGACIAPPLEKGKLKIGVYGYTVDNDEYTLVISPAPVELVVREGSFNENDVEGDVATPTELEAHYELVEALVESGRLTGPKGDKGDKGDTGSTGATGADGKSAYEVAVDEGYSGTEAEWLLSLKGEKGDKGDKGNKGNTGQDGKSAYQVAVDSGYEGTIAEWLASLKGDGYTTITIEDGTDISQLYYLFGEGVFAVSDEVEIDIPDNKTLTLCQGAIVVITPLTNHYASNFSAVIFGLKDYETESASPIFVYRTVDNDVYASYIPDMAALEDAFAYLANEIEGKQDTLTAGAGISISEQNVISATAGINIEVVQALPSTGDTQTIYLVPNSGSAPNIYDEYIYVNSSWEKIGTTEVDLSNYYNKTETDTLLSAKVGTSNVKQSTGQSTTDLMSQKAVTDALSGKLSNPLIFTNVSANSWVSNSDSDYDYDYKCVLTCQGVTANMLATVIFAEEQATSGNYALTCVTGTDSVTIYSNDNTSITIPTIIAGVPIRADVDVTIDSQLADGSVTFNKLNDDIIQYSTSERIVGKWIDGTPVYERTYVLRENGTDNYTYTGTMSSGGHYAIGLTNIKTIWLNGVWAKRTDESGKWTDIATNSIELTTVYNNTDGSLYFKDTHSPSDIIVILRYTKTTD